MPHRGPEPASEERRRRADERRHPRLPETPRSRRRFQAAHNPELLQLSFLQGTKTFTYLIKLT